MGNHAKENELEWNERRNEIEFIKEIEHRSVSFSAIYIKTRSHNLPR